MIKMERRGIFATYTGWIILTNVLVFILGIGLLNLNQSFIKYLAIQPAAILSGRYLWTFVTSMFMHANFNHLIFNMLSLMIYSSNANLANKSCVQRTMKKLCIIQRQYLIPV